MPSPAGPERAPAQRQTTSIPMGMGVFLLPYGGSVQTVESPHPAKGFGGRERVKGNRQGSLLRQIKSNHLWGLFKGLKGLAELVNHVGRPTFSTN